MREVLLYYMKGELGSGFISSKMRIRVPQKPEFFLAENLSQVSPVN